MPAPVLERSNSLGVAREQRHDGLVERRLHEHRQPDRDRDAPRVHGSILPAHAAARAAPVAARGAGRSSTMRLHSQTIIRRRDARAGSSRTTTLRLGAQAPLTRSAQGANRNAFPPRLPACLAEARLHGAARHPPAGPGRPTCSPQYSPWWDSQSGLRSRSSCCAAAAARWRRCARRPSASSPPPAARRTPCARRRRSPPRSTCSRPAARPRSSSRAAASRSRAPRSGSARARPSSTSSRPTSRRARGASPSATRRSPSARRVRRSSSTRRSASSSASPR